MHIVYVCVYVWRPGHVCIYVYMYIYVYTGHISTDIGYMIAYVIYMTAPPTYPILPGSPLSLPLPLSLSSSLSLSFPFAINNKLIRLIMLIVCYLYGGLKT